VQLGACTTSAAPGRLASCKAANDSGEGTLSSVGSPAASHRRGPPSRSSSWLAALYWLAMVGIVKRVGKSENPRYAICTRQALLKLLQVGPTGELSPAHALHYLSPCDKDGLFDFWPKMHIWGNSVRRSSSGLATRAAVKGKCS
jgi:hypothetical protein